jgi:hypothetical protein
MKTIGPFYAAREGQTRTIIRHISEKLQSLPLHLTEVWNGRIQRRRSINALSQTWTDCWSGFTLLRDGGRDMSKRSPVRCFTRSTTS